MRETCRDAADAHHLQQKALHHRPVQGLNGFAGAANVIRCHTRGQPSTTCNKERAMHTDISSRGPWLPWLGATSERSQRFTSAPTTTPTRLDSSHYHSIDTQRMQLKSMRCQSSHTGLRYELEFHNKTYHDCQIPGLPSLVSAAAAAAAAHPRRARQWFVSKDTSC